MMYYVYDHDGNGRPDRTARQPAKAGDDRRIASGVKRLVNPALILGQKDRKRRTGNPADRFVQFCPALLSSAAGTAAVGAIRGNHRQALAVTASRLRFGSTLPPQRGTAILRQGVRHPRRNLTSPTYHPQRRFDRRREARYRRMAA